MEKKVSKEVVKPYSCLPRSPRFIRTPVGENIIPKTRYFVKDGVRCAEAAKGLDLKSFLKSSQASTDIASIVARYSAGDSSVLNVRSDGISGDFVNMPKNVNDMQDLKVKMMKTFDSLKPEVKDKFNDFADFYACCLDGSLSSRVGKKSFNELNSDKNSVENHEDIPAEEKPIVEPEIGGKDVK